MAKEREEQHWNDKVGAKETVTGAVRSVKRVDDAGKDSEGREVALELIEGIDDIEVDELIQWSQSLDFDK